MKLGGIIYLYDIKQSRIASTREDLDLLRRLAQQDTAHNTIVTTTKWQPKIGVEVRNEEALITRYWKGSTVPRFMDSHQSAWEIIDLVLQKGPLDTSEFQKVITKLHGSPKTPPKSPWGIFAYLFGERNVGSLRICCFCVTYCVPVTSGDLIASDRY